MLGQFSFHRVNLAKAYCDSLAGQGIANATSGLFLAGPRRVGKSTFLIEDLMPEAKARDWLPVYVDLWANKLSDPALLITEAVKASIAAHKGRLSKLAKHVKVNILKTVELDFSKPGLPEHITLADLLIDLVHLSGKRVLLIVDEAQHALTTPQGINAMFSIKSARDQINKAAEAPKLMLVFTGSNRDKLAQLVFKKDQPFFGSEITAFPLLGKEYSDFFTDQVNEALANQNQFTKESMWEAFQLTGQRPEILRQIVGRTAISNEAQSFSALLKEDATLWQNQIWADFENDFNALPKLHRTILTLLIEKGRQWTPFSEDSMAYYQKATEEPSLTASTVQTAIQSLRDQGILWQSSRGTYALEDESFGEWFRHALGDNNFVS